jgi:hypothetical protein
MLILFKGVYELWTESTTEALNIVIGQRFLIPVCLPLIAFASLLLRPKPVSNTDGTSGITIGQNATLKPKGLLAISLITSYARKERYCD